MSVSLDTVVKLVQIASYIASTVAAVWAFVVYRGNSRRERARWAEGLYSRFFEREELKKVRDLLDTDADDTQVQDLVTNETSDWTDYLKLLRVRGLPSII